jgi:hypothetical protein
VAVEVKIPPCPQSKDGKHAWVYSKRKHGRSGRKFIECSCSQTAQISENGIKFLTTRMYVDEKKSVHGNYRITRSRKEKILSAYESVQDFLDNGRVM